MCWKCRGPDACCVRRDSQYVIRGDGRLAAFPRMVITIGTLERLIIEFPKSKKVLLNRAGGINPFAPIRNWNRVA